jgi:hypothetical protein
MGHEAAKNMVLGIAAFGLIDKSAKAKANIVSHDRLVGGPFDRWASSIKGDDGIKALFRLPDEWTPEDRDAFWKELSNQFLFGGGKKRRCQIFQRLEISALVHPDCYYRLRYRKGAKLSATDPQSKCGIHGDRGNEKDGVCFWLEYAEGVAHRDDMLDAGIIVDEDIDRMTNNDGVRWIVARRR